MRDAYKAFIDQEVLTGVTFQIHPKERVALIGPNGAGKSTILKIIMGMEDLDEGEFTKSGQATLGYLPQDFDWDCDVTLYAGMLEVFQSILAISDRLRKLEAEMGKVEVLENEILYTKVMAEYSKMLERYESMDGYSIESRIKGVLKGLGFNEKDFQLKINQLSGGQKTRAGLARLLLTTPHLLLLDEPTNHLDLNAREWLEGFLKDYSGSVLIISHDRYFLDQIVNRVMELRYGDLEHYPGNYSFYIKERQRRLLEWQREYDKQQEKIATTEEFIRRNIEGVNTKQAQGRRKRLERLERIKKPPVDLNIPKIHFTSKKRSGNDVLKIAELSKRYPGLTLFENVNLNLYRGDKIGIVGPNGAGKTTFLKVILGQLDSDDGQVVEGAGVQITYYSQEHDSLANDELLLNYFRYKYRLTEQEGRDLLAKFLFIGDDVFKEIGNLSGGERSRLVIAELSLEKGNLMILDEPTNHLDITATEVLEEALKDFNGTILMVSHDRFFVERIANKIWEIDKGKVKEYYGTYSKYKRKKEEEVKIIEEKKVSGVKKDFLKKQKERNEEQILQRKIEEVESEIHTLEIKRDILADELADPTLYQRSEIDFLKKNEEYQNICKRLEELYQSWETMVS